MRMTQARVMAVAAGGMIKVRLFEKDTNDVLPVGRAVGSAAVVGDNVLVLIDGPAAQVVSLLGTGPAQDVPPQEAPGGGGSETQATIRGTEAISPTWTGSWQSGRWRTESDTTDIIQSAYGSGAPNRGAAFFGRKPAALGTLRAGRLWYTRLPNAGNNAAEVPTFVLLGASTRPSTFPAVLATAAGTAVTWRQRVMWGLPAAWLSQLQTGSAGGVGTLASGPYMRLDGETFQLNLDWERTT